MKKETKVFLVKIESTDEKRFNSMMINSNELTSENKTKISKKLIKMRSIKLWGFLSSEKNKTIWEKISKNDWFLFNVNNRYSYATRVVEKAKLEELSGLIEQPRNPRERMDLFVLFNNLFEISKGTDRTNHEFGLKTRNNPNWKFLQVPHNHVSDIVRDYRSLENFFGIDLEIKKKTRKIPLIVPASIKKIPRKTHSTIIRNIRDTNRSKKLKKVYQNKCQLCRYAFPDASEGYSEVHHVWPHAENGDDDYDNMLVLCPNHHAEFDYGVIRFGDENTDEIIDISGNQVGKLSFKIRHRLAKKNIEYHNNVRARKINES